MFTIVEHVSQSALAALRVGGLPVLVAIFVLKGAIVGKVVPTSVVFPGYLLSIGATYRQALVVVIVVTAAHAVGQLAVYGTARWHGPTALSWLPVGPTPESGSTSRVTRSFERHGGLAVLVTNLVPWTRGLIAIPAGLGAYPPGRYVACLCLSSLLYHGVYAAVPVVGSSILG